jgi:hypothetical protein
MVAVSKIVRTVNETANKYNRAAWWANGGRCRD